VEEGASERSLSILTRTEEKQNMTGWLTEKDAQDYGYDVLDLAQRAAMHALSPELQRINEQNQDLRRQVAQERHRGLEQALDSSVPNWREIDNDPRWREWLASPYELSGASRQQHLNDAMARGDAHRVASFFRGFLSQHRQRQASQPAPSAMPTGRRVYSRQDIVRYSDAYRRGQIPEAEYARLQADLVAAAKEGRIMGIGPPKGKAPYG
jgi:hypothetical protein